METQFDHADDPLPSPTLDRRALLTLLPAMVAGGSIGGVAGALAPVPAEDDHPALLRRIAAHPAATYSTINDDRDERRSVTIGFPGFALLCIVSDDAEPSILLMNDSAYDGRRFPAMRLLSLIADTLDAQPESASWA